MLPSLLLLIGLSWVYVAYSQQPLIAGLFYGIKPAVTAIVLQAALRIGGRTLKNSYLSSIAAAALIAIFVFAVPFPVIIAAAALTGYLGSRIAPARFSTGGARTTASAATQAPQEAKACLHR